jgi:hypothetical protein
MKKNINNQIQEEEKIGSQELQQQGPNDKNKEKYKYPKKIQDIARALSHFTLLISHDGGIYEIDSSVVQDFLSLIEKKNYKSSENFKDCDFFLKPYSKNFANPKLTDSFIRLFSSLTQYKIGDQKNTDFITANDIRDAYHHIFLNASENSFKNLNNEQRKKLLDLNLFYKIFVDKDNRIEPFDSELNLNGLNLSSQGEKDKAIKKVENVFSWIEKENLLKIFISIYEENKSEIEKILSPFLSYKSFDHNEKVNSFLEIFPNSSAPIHCEVFKTLFEENFFKMEKMPNDAYQKKIFKYCKNLIDNLHIGYKNEIGSENKKLGLISNEQKLYQEYRDLYLIFYKKNNEKEYNKQENNENNQENNKNEYYHQTQLAKKEILGILEKQEKTR